MRDLSGIPANKLLSTTAPEALFSSTKASARAEYRSLAMRWHPDHERSDIAARVFAHINMLYRAALIKIAAADWNEPFEKIEAETIGIKRYRTKSGTKKEVEYISIRNFELGRMLIGDHSVSFEVRAEFADLFDNGLRRIKRLHYEDKRMAAEMSSYLPQIVDTFETLDSDVLTVRKTPDQLLLADVLKTFAGSFEQTEHCGWILNVLLNLACYLQWAALTHNAIAADTFFISPLRHNGMLLGGWWYSTLAGHQLEALPDQSFSIFPPDVIRNKRADARGDLELIKALGRQLLGHRCDRSFANHDTSLEQLLEWLELPSDGIATDDYKFWKYNILPAVFGRPKFVTMKLASADIYKEV